MKGDSKVSLMSSVEELCRVSEANQQRIQNLELAVANLTCICESIRRDISFIGLSNRGSFKKTRSRSSSSLSLPSLELKKGDMLGIQMQQLVHQATALGIIKQPKTNDGTKVRLESPKRAVMQNVQTTTKKQKRLIQTTESTTENKLSMKLGAIKNNIGATQPKGNQKTSPNNSMATATAKVSLRSTVKKTETTISEVYVGATANKRSKETVSNKSSIKNVERVKGRGSVKLAVKTYDADNDNSDNAVKFGALTVTCSSRTPPASDVNVRRKWNTAKETISK